MTNEEKLKVEERFDTMFSKNVFTPMIKDILLKFIKDENEQAYEQGLKDGADKERLTKLAEGL